MSINLSSVLSVPGLDRPGRRVRDAAIQCAGPFNMRTHSETACSLARDGDSDRSIGALVLTNVTSGAVYEDP
jgi:hypothetical protein